MVDIGYHYVALDTNGVPVDTDGDGLADYLEDRNGNGIYDGGDYSNLFVADTDGDGVSDFQEYLDGTNPQDADSMKGLLARWHFDTTNWPGAQGQLPLTNTNLQLVTGVSSNALHITNYTSMLRYKLVESNGNTNLDMQNGTVRFWFKPNWSSLDQGGKGPGSDFAQLVAVDPTTSGWWGFYLGPDGISFTFEIAGPGGHGFPILAPVSFLSNQWYQIAVTYSPSISVLYINGKMAATGDGVFAMPSFDRFTVGNSHWGDFANGALDELETYDHPLSASEIDSDFWRVVDDGDWPFSYYLGHSPPEFTITAPSEGSIF